MMETATHELKAVEAEEYQRYSIDSLRVCAITCDCYPDDPLVRRTAEAAASAGCSYHVICSMKEGQARDELFNGVHVHRIKLRGRQGKPLGRISGMPLGTMLVLWLIFLFLSSTKLTRLHIIHKFHVVHIHNLPDFLVFAALIPKFFGAQVVLHVQDVSPELTATRATGRWRRIAVALARWQEHMSTAFADHVLTTGRIFKEILLKHGVPEAKLSMIHNSADPKLFPAEKRTEPYLGEASAERPILLMYHGTCAARCGLDVAIRAFAKARSKAPFLRLHIMGQGEALPSLKELAQTLGLADYITFFPTGPVDTVADFIEHRDIGIIPYLNGFMDLVLPTKAYEFALMRRPMIASDTVGMRSMFRAQSIVLCAPSSADSLAEAITDLYWHPLKRAQLVLSAEADNMNYRWELMAERYRQLLVSLATTSDHANPH
jgi:glycosyltransferase involved in cell wall biosynthesis